MAVDKTFNNLLVFYSYSAADAIPELKRSNFQALALNRNCLIAVGKVRTNAPEMSS